MRMKDLFFYCLLQCGMTLKQQNRSWVIFDNETKKYKQNYQVIAHITTCIWTQSLMLYLMLTQKKCKITFFSIISKISIFVSQYFVRIYLGVVQNHPVQKIRFFLGTMAGKDGKVTFCYISISYLKIDIRQFLRPSQRAGLICFYHGNR